jgi:hypothetical protein
MLSWRRLTRCWLTMAVTSARCSFTGVCGGGGDLHIYSYAAGCWLRHQLRQLLGEAS